MHALFFKSCVSEISKFKFERGSKLPGTSSEALVCVGEGRGGEERELGCVCLQDYH